MRIPLISGIRANAAMAAGALVLAAASLLLFAPSAGAASASVTLKKDSNGLFLLTINDADGIKEFSLVPSGQAPYGGEIAKCPRTFQSSNVLFRDPADFTPFMAASITDCRGNTDELEIPPPEAGATRSKRPKPPAPPPTPALTPAPTPPSAAETAIPVSEQARRDHAATEEAKAKVSYPVAELGDCGSEAACRAYCEDLANIKACIAYAEAHGLVTAEEAKQGRKFADIGGKGPGGCTSRESCAAYCEDISRIEGCLDFAEKNGFLSGKELEEVRVVAKAKREGVAFPGGCTSKAACEVYCGEASHIDECLAFAERSGLIPPEELAMAKKMMPLIKAGKTPGGCTRKEACEAYCQRPANIRQCLAFAEEQGLIPPEELEMAKKFMPLMEKGETPGGCTRKETCEAYCGEAGHMEECIAFGEKAGFISQADAELARKTGGKGPGDCKSKETCEAFCKQPENLKTCQAFAREHGMDAGGGGGPGGCTSQEECEAFCQANPQECQGFGPPGGGPGGFPGGGPSGPGGPGGFPGGGPGGGFPGGGIPSGADYVGPGGCRTPDECIRYCKEPGHEKECNEFKTPATTPYAKGRGPGGCGSVEECREYCHANQAECDAFVSEDVPPEGKCQAGYQIERDALGYKYCNPLSCPEGQAFHTDVFGRRACGPVGIPGGPEGGGSPGAPSGVPPSGCSFEDLNPVCAEASPGKHHTFNNECFAKAFGAANLRPGTCPGDVPCPTVRNPVCAVKGRVTQSYFNRCAAEGDDASILYTGECKPGIPAGGFPGVPPEGFPATPSQPPVPGFPQVPPGGFPAVPGFTPPQVPPGAVPPSGGSQPPYEYQVDCSLFAQAPKCSTIGPEGSQNYQLCVKCFPDRAAGPPSQPLASTPGVTAPLGLILAPFLGLFR